MSESIILPDTEPFIDQKDHIEWQSRIAHISKEYGFLPTTTIELNEAFELIGFLSEPGKTAAHLNEVLKHQQKSKDPSVEPQDAVRSITRLMHGFATDADTRAGRITDLLGVIHLVNPNLELKLVDEAKTHRGLIDVMQFMSARQAAMAGGSFLRGRLIGEPGDRVLRTDFEADLADEILTELLTEDLQKMSVFEIRQLAERAVASHSNRITFWQYRLSEARAHIIANRLLQQLDAA